MASKKILHARTTASLGALTSPLRLEIIEWLRAEQELSIRELAEKLQRKPSSVTYHVRLLERAGLVAATSQRRSGKRDEAVYSLTASEIRMGDPGRDHAEYRIRTLRVLLRLATREFERATLEAGSAGKDPETIYATRQRARLTRAEQRTVRRHAAAIQEVFEGARHGRRGSLLAWTAVMTPLPAPPA